MKRVILCAIALILSAISGVDAASLGEGLLHAQTASDVMKIYEDLIHELALCGIINDSLQTRLGENAECSGAFTLIPDADAEACRRGAKPPRSEAKLPSSDIAATTGLLTGLGLNISSVELLKEFDQTKAKQEGYYLPLASRLPGDRSSHQAPVEYDPFYVRRHEDGPLQTYNAQRHYKSCNDPDEYATPVCIISRNLPSPWVVAEIAAALVALYLTVRRLVRR